MPKPKQKHIILLAKKVFV